MEKGQRSCHVELLLTYGLSVVISRWTKSSMVLECPWHSAAEKVVALMPGCHRIPIEAQCKNARILHIECTLKNSRWSNNPEPSIAASLIAQLAILGLKPWFFFFCKQRTTVNKTAKICNVKGSCRSNLKGSASSFSSFPAFRPSVYVEADLCTILEKWSSLVYHRPLVSWLVWYTWQNWHY